MNIIFQNKKDLNFSKVIKKLNEWKNLNYGLYTTEFQYMHINKKIFVEKYLTKKIVDYKIYCFNGKPEFILVKLNNKNYNIINNYINPDWKLTELETTGSQYIREPNYKIKKPKKLKIMLKYSKLLSQEFVFVRFDLY